MKNKEIIINILLNRAEFCDRMAEFGTTQQKISFCKKSVTYKSAAEKLDTMSIRKYKNELKKAYFVLGKQLTSNFRSETSENLAKSEFEVLSEILLIL